MRKSEQHRLLPKAVRRSTPADIAVKEFSDHAQARDLALAIVETLPGPFLVLDDTLHLLAASRCFYEVYGEEPGAARGRSLFELSGGQWDIPGPAPAFARCPAGPQRP